GRHMGEPMLIKEARAGKPHPNDQSQQEGGRQAVAPVMKEVITFQLELFGIRSFRFSLPKELRRTYRPFGKDARFLALAFFIFGLMLQVPKITPPAPSKSTWRQLLKAFTS